MSCIFCEMISGKVEANFVYQSDEVVAFLSEEQPNPYKVVVAPRKHIETIYDLDDQLAACIFQATVHVARAIRRASNCPGLSLVQANGHAAQQRVRHFHLHLLPRFPHDTALGRVFLRWEGCPAERSELERLAADLHAQLSHQSHSC
ncbi:HIT family protein [Thermogemmatispora tikiterensis]|nr:HIT family protein [Thermogemmatispora tikiterensis]